MIFIADRGLARAMFREIERAFTTDSFPVIDRLHDWIQAQRLYQALRICKAMLPSPLLTVFSFDPFLLTQYIKVPASRIHESQGRSNLWFFEATSSNLGTDA